MEFKKRLMADPAIIPGAEGVNVLDGVSIWVMEDTDIPFPTALEGRKQVDLRTMMSDIVTHEGDRIHKENKDAGENSRGCRPGCVMARQG